MSRRNPQTKTAPLLPADVLAHHQQALEQADQKRRQAEAVQQADYALANAGNLVQDLGGHYENEQNTDKGYLRKWVGAMAAYKGRLAERGWLERLDQPPTGLAECERDAWVTAVPLFLASDTDPERAATALAELMTTAPNLALEVARWLRGGIRRVAEGHWDAVPPVVLRSLANGDGTSGTEASQPTQPPNPQTSPPAPEGTRRDAARLTFPRGHETGRCKANL